MEEIKNRYVVTVEGKEYDIYLSPLEQYGRFLIEFNGRKFTITADELTDRKFLFKIDNMSSEVDIDRKNDHLEVFLEGKEMSTVVEPFYLAELRKKAGASVGGPSEMIITAPMPGLVLNAEVKPGDVVEKGQTLVIIEAMKMENLIKSPYEGTVKKIFVDSGQAVDKNEKLVELE
jgi:biotin carboxyl carrier protein